MLVEAEVMGTNSSMYYRGPLIDVDVELELTERADMPLIASEIIRD